MNDFLRYQKVLSIIILCLVIIGAGGLYALWPNRWEYCIGLFWGGAGGLFIFRLKVIAIIRFAQNSEHPPAKIGFQQIAATVFFLGVAIVVNKYVGEPQYSREILNPWAVFAGLVLPNAVLMADGLLRPAALTVNTAANETTAAETPKDGDDSSSDF